MKNIQFLESVKLKYIHDRLYINLDSFIGFLKSNHSPSDTIKVKASNVIRDFSSYPEGIKDIDGEKHVLFFNCLKFIFKYSHNFQVCKQTALDVEEIVLHGERLSTSLQSHHELYQEISDTRLKPDFLFENSLQHLDIKNLEIPTLFREFDYEKKFTEVQWKKICLFEYHFSKYVYTDKLERGKFETLIGKKYWFWNEINKAGELAANIVQWTKKEISERFQRKAATADRERISVFNDCHLPEILETDVLNLLSSLAPDNQVKVLCFDCDKSCRHRKGIHIPLEYCHDDFTEFDDTCDIIRKTTHTEHNLLCPTITLVRSGSLTNYFNRGLPCRFKLRDDIALGKLSSRVVHRSDQDDTEIYADSSVEKCNKCFKCSAIRPLHWSSFDINQEYVLSIPLPIQLYLESFINKRTVAKCVDINVTTESKLTSLYSTYDRLLNIYNKNFLGILQERNTEELSMHYQSVNTVFSITSSMGSTLSLNAAEAHLKSMVAGDSCYFNTYLKKYPISYNTSAGTVKMSKNLRKCILTLMLDNLVRMKYHNDPNPGESRSFHMCTLPITIKGIPDDSLEIDQWHDPEICTGEKVCC